MTTTFQPVPRTGSSTATKVVVGLVGTVLAFVLAIVGITFFALAIAFPLAIPFAERFELFVPASDIELAKQFASVWWLFLAGSIVSFAAALGTLVGLVRSLSPTSED